MSATNNIPQFDSGKNNLTENQEVNSSGFKPNTLISSGEVNQSIYNVSLAITSLLNTIAENTGNSSTYSNTDSLNELTEKLSNDIKNWLVQNKSFTTDTGSKGTINENGVAIYQTYENDKLAFRTSGYVWTYVPIENGSNRRPYYSFAAPANELKIQLASIYTNVVAGHSYDIFKIVYNGDSLFSVIRGETDINTGITYIKSYATKGAEYTTTLQGKKGGLYFDSFGYLEDYYILKYKTFNDINDARDFIINTGLNKIIKIYYNNLSSSSFSDVMLYRMSATSDIQFKYILNGNFSYNLTDTIVTSTTPITIVYLDVLPNGGN